MNRTLKTAGVSFALLTACLSANSVFADSKDDIDLDCWLATMDNCTSLNWNEQYEKQVSSYKLYISGPVSQTESNSTDIVLKYVEDSSKLNSDSCNYDFQDLEKGKYYRFKLEAYKGNKLVKAESFGSVILEADQKHYLDEDEPLKTRSIDSNTLELNWNCSLNDNVKRSMKFYRIEDDGFHEIGTADYAAGTYTFTDLQPDKKYHIAAELYEGDKMLFTYQFGFSAQGKKSNVDIKDIKEYYLVCNAGLKSQNNMNVSLSWYNGPEDLSYLPGIEYKVRLSKPLSSKEFYAGRPEYDRTYSFFENYHIDYYSPYNDFSAFDQYGIYKKAAAGKYKDNYTYDPEEDSIFDISGLEPGKYYRVKAEAYLKGKLIASDTSFVVNDSTEKRGHFSGDFDDAKVKTKDGKTADISWNNYLYEDDPQGKRTVYFYLSSPYKDENKVYSGNEYLGAEYIGKTDYSKLKYRIKGLKPGRHYRLYMEVRYKGGVEENYSIGFSTTVRNPEPELTQIGTDSVKLAADSSEGYYWKSGKYESSAYYENNCLKPDGFEYYKKGKDGKFKKIASAPFSRSVIDKNVSLGKTYTYKVRGYITLNGKKYYSGFSSDKYTIKIANPKPLFKLEIVDKNKNIVKITSDKNNETAEISVESDIRDLRHGTDPGKLKNGDIVIKPGKTLYIRLLNKKSKEVLLEYDRFGLFNLSLDFRKGSFKLTKE